ncbi:hypothetical protein JCM6882_002824 [Rhodosporidiobolus microsporus]
MNREAIKTAAGFGADEPIVHPYLKIVIPDELLKGIFPWVDDELHSKHPHDKGTLGTLKLLRSLRPFVVLHYANVYQYAPTSPLFRHLDLFDRADNPYIPWFRDEYPRLLQIEKDKAAAAIAQFNTVDDAAVRGALSLIYRAQQQNQVEVEERFKVVDRRTEWASPLKLRRLNDGTDFAPFPLPPWPPYYYTYPPQPPYPSYPPLSSASLPPPSHSPEASPSPADWRLPTPPPPPAFASASSSRALASNLPPPSASTPRRLTEGAPFKRPRADEPERPAPWGYAASPALASQASAAAPYHPPFPSFAHPFAPYAAFTPSQAAPSAPGPRPPPAPTLAPPSSAPRSAASLVTPSPSRNVACITDHGPSPCNFILPHDLRAFSRSGTPTPPSLEGVFSWSTILEQVVAPLYLWQTYKPEPQSGYRSVKEVWLHWSEGREGQSVEGLGRLPSLEMIDRVFGDGSAAGRWQEGVQGKERQQWSTFLALPKRITFFMNRDKCSADQAIAHILSLTGTKANQVSETTRKARKLISLP